MLNLVIIALILVSLAVHRYLTTFWEQGTLPYPFGFIFFANSLIVVYLTSFIWIFGVIAGVVVSLLCFLQVVYTACLWIFSLPWLLSVHRNLTIPKVNPLVYGGFSFLVMAIAALTVVNFFVSPYKGMWDLIGDNVWTIVAILSFILVVGNVVRINLMTKLMKQ